MNDTTIGEPLPRRAQHDVRICGVDIRGRHPGFPGLYEVVFKLNTEPRPLWVSMFEAHQKQIPGIGRRRDTQSAPVKVYRNEAHWAASKEQILDDTRWIDCCVEAANEDFSAHVLKVWQRGQAEAERHTAEQREIEELKAALRRFGSSVLPGRSSHEVQRAAERLEAEPATSGGKR